MSHKPGMTNLPDASTTRAVAGTLIVLPAPTLTMRPRSTTMVPSRIGMESFIVWIVAWMMARGRRAGMVGEPACCAWAGAATATARTARARRSARRGAGILKELLLGIREGWWE